MCVRETDREMKKEKGKEKEEYWERERNREYVRRLEFFQWQQRARLRSL